jgi:hypothetical protein
VHFGLGAATSARATIHWPSGEVESRDLPADRSIELREGEAPRL